MRTLSIDIETYSSADLGAVGVYKYAEAPDFEVLLFAYAFDDGDVDVIDLTLEDLPLAVISALTDPDIEKHAFNAAFERICLSRLLGLPAGEYLDPAQWRCTMVQAAYFGAIGSLKNVGAFLKVPVEKDAAGTRLINKFSKPRAKKVRREGEDWARFREYCRRDVEVERSISDALPAPIPDSEQALYVIDQKINDRGVLIDANLAARACEMSAANAEDLFDRLKALTGLENPNSPAQLLSWLRSRGCDISSCAKDVLLEEAAKDGIDPNAKRAIELRLASAKASVKKYIVARDAACKDGRLRGSFMFYGAATGRWAGRLMQLQNLPRGDLAGAALDGARELVSAGDIDGVRLLYGDVQDTLKSMVRTTLVAPSGKCFVVADFSAIEARVLAWLAGEEWVLDVFRTTGKVYEATASRMFGVPIEQVDKQLRARGKVATLALGYQGGPAALERMGALQAGIPEKELPKIVRMWRNANKQITGLWSLAEVAVRNALTGRGASRICRGRVYVRKAPEVRGFALRLPSGRELIYRNARVREDYHIVYEVCSKGAGAQEVETYGGRIVENITQAVARDLLAVWLEGLEDDPRYKTVAHIHDEVVCEADMLESPAQALSNVGRPVLRPPAWAPGLPLDYDGYTCLSYRKE